MVKRCHYSVFAEMPIAAGQRPMRSVRFPGTKSGLKRARVHARRVVRDRKWVWSSVLKHCRGRYGFDERIVFECDQDIGKVRCRKVARDPWD